MFSVVINSWKVDVGAFLFFSDSEFLNWILSNDGQNHCPYSVFWWSRRLCEVRVHTPTAGLQVKPHLPWCFLTHWLVGWLVGGGVEAHSRCLLFFSSTWLSSLISSLKVHAAAVLHVHVTANSLFFALLRRRPAVSNFVDLPLTVKYVSCHWIFVSVIILCTKPLNDLVSVCFWRSLKRLLNFDLTLLFFYMH